MVESWEPTNTHGFPYNVDDGITAFNVNEKDPFFFVYSVGKKYLKIYLYLIFISFLN